MSFLDFFKKEIKFSNMFDSVDVGIDLGTANILAYVKGEGIVLQEPSVVAVNKRSGRVVAVGQNAKEMLGRTPDEIMAVRPLREGVIADYDITQDMLEDVLRRVGGSSPLFKPRVMICIPSGVTTVEKRAVIEATMQAGANKAFLIEEPMAAAIGAGLDVSATKGHMLVDIGGGTTDIAVICLGGLVVAESLRVGGDKFDEMLVRYLKKEHNILIGESTAEEIKIKIATVHRRGRAEHMTVRGRDLVTGLPTTLTITSAETRKAFAEITALIISSIKGVLERTPPELAADIIDTGIVLTGGGSLLDGLAQRIQDETQITTYIAENPLDCVALGTGKALENIEALKESVYAGNQSKF